MTKEAKHMGIVKPKHKELKSEVTSGHKKKKKVKVRKPYYWNCCPFCDTELPKDEKKPECWWYWGRIMICPNTTCGAYEIEGACPCCHRPTFFLPDDKSNTTGVYKHCRRYGCGFEGRKKV